MLGSYPRVQLLTVDRLLDNTQRLDRQGAGRRAPTMGAFFSLARLLLVRLGMASKRRLRRKAESAMGRQHGHSCVRKRRYTTRAAALRALIQLIIHKPSPTLLSPYYCYSCHGFHFGHAAGEKPAAPAIQRRRAERLRRWRAKVAARQAEQADGGAPNYLAAA
jgi:hypothetical protein